MLATIIGTLAAYALWKRGSAWLSGSLYLSLVTPEIVTGVSLLALFQWAFRFLHLRLGMHTVILAHVAFSVAYVAVVVMARLRTFDPALEEAALDLGATDSAGLPARHAARTWCRRSPRRRCSRSPFRSTIT